MTAEIELPSQADTTNLPEDAVQVRVMRELFTRSRESSMVGFIPVFLLTWAHMGAQELKNLVYWALATFLALTYRLLVAHFFLISPQTQESRLKVWFVLEWLGAVVLATAWVSCITLLGSGQVDPLFYLRLIFLVGLVAFVLSALGIDMRLYASFVAVIVGGTLYLLHAYYPRFVTDLPVVTPGFIAFGFMLLVRSRGEQRRTQEWVRARLSQRLLLDQLNQTIRQELLTHEALRLKSMELEATNRKLADLATHDTLTGTLRRGHVENELRRLVLGMQRKHGLLCAMLIDIDLFKQVNDRHGHAVGDEVLRRMTALIGQTLRGSDMFGRWGGEEFIVLMPDIGMAQAVEAAERVRKAVHTLAFEGAGVGFGISVSIGVAQLEPGETADSLALRVDKALYAAKNSGRDCVKTAAQT
jgi:diguanylate cyclase (GGDEF)-like protein